MIKFKRGGLKRKRVFENPWCYTSSSLRCNFASKGKRYYLDPFHFMHSQLPTVFAGKYLFLF